MYNKLFRHSCSLAVVSERNAMRASTPWDGSNDMYAHRKLVVNGVLVYIHDPHIRLGIGFAVCFLSLILSFAVRPFARCVFCFCFPPSYICVSLAFPTHICVCQYLDARVGTWARVESWLEYKHISSIFTQDTKLESCTVQNSTIWCCRGCRFKPSL